MPVITHRQRQKKPERKSEVEMVNLHQICVIINEVSRILGRERC